MQFTAFNNNSTIPVKSEISWPNANCYFKFNPVAITIGLLNNTLYDILATTDSSFMNATVNATSVQSNCGLLANLSFSNSVLQNLSFLDNGIGSGYFVLNASYNGKFFILKITYCGLLMAFQSLSHQYDFKLQEIKLPLYQDIILIHL
ncbi:hypothetical protein J3R83DRAFT_9235 [Lanmaoa asiatica]|nr:hypothetical protein J3R83DRAFT_9235 [Lanmaoa asiatica]